MKITLAGGGFHNAKPMEIDIPEDRVFNIERIFKTFRYPYELPTSMALLNSDEYAAHRKHVCGMADCECGSHLPTVMSEPGDNGDEMFFVACKI